MDPWLAVSFLMALFLVSCCCILHWFQHFEFHKFINIDWCPSSLNSPKNSISVENDSNKPQKKRFGSEEAIIPRPSLKQRMRASSLVVLDEVRAGPKQNNFWCCHITKRLHPNKAHICVCIYSSEEESEFYRLGVMLYFIFLFVIIICIFLIRHQYDLKYFDYSSIGQLNADCFFKSALSNTDLLRPMSMNNIFIFFILVWESMLNFYRCYSARFTSINLYPPSMRKIFVSYSAFMIIFVFLLIIQTYFIYVIYPIIMLLHFAFNIYCIYGFNSVLIGQYLHYKLEQEAIFREIRHDLKRTIIKLLFCSLFSTVISNIFLLLIIACYNTNIILIFGPFWWSINAILWNVTFVKNSTFLQTQFTKMKECDYKCCTIKEMLDKERKFSESGIVKNTQNENYLKNKQEKAKQSYAEKFPNFMANNMDLGVINDDAHSKVNNNEKSLVPSSATRTPTLIPYSSNIDSPNTNPTLYNLSSRTMPGIELSSEKTVSNRSILPNFWSPTNTSVVSVVPLNDVALSLDFMENTDMSALSKSKSDPNSRLKMTKMKLAALNPLSVPETSEDIVDSDSDNEHKQAQQTRPQSQSHSFKRYVSRITQIGFNREEQYHDTAPCVFDLLVKDGCYSQKTVEMLKLWKQRLEQESPNTSEQVQKALSEYTGKNVRYGTDEPTASKQVSAHI